MIHRGEHDHTSLTMYCYAMLPSRNASIHAVTRCPSENVHTLERQLHEQGIV